MKISTMLLAIVSLMGLEVIAMDSIKANLTILNHNKHAESQSNSIHSYLVKSATSSNYTKMSGTGNFSQVNQSNNEDQSTQIGVDVQGYTQIVLQSAGDGRLVVNTDSNLTSSKDGVEMTIDYQLETEAVITKGTWEDYLEGKEIEYQLTEDSLKREAKTAGKNFSKSIEAALKNGLAAQGLSSITMESVVTVKPKGENSQACKATLSALDCYNAKQEIEVNILIEGI